MKKLFLSLSILLSMFFVFNCTGKTTEKTKKTDPVPAVSDSIFKAYLLTNFDTNADGEISDDEAAKVTAINCSGLEIKSLDGIERFTAIESLDCSNNKLSEIDVRKNKLLNKLVCNGNPKGMFIYIGMSSKLRNPALRAPKAGDQPSLSELKQILLDMSKCTYDINQTNVQVFFED